jgi:hypothetical protein
MAQQWGNPERLASEVGKTDDIIDRAREAVSESGSERARNQLVMAVRLQKMARDLLGRSFSEIDNALAMQIGKYTISARRKAQQAVAITRQAEENEDYVRRRLERTSDLIRRLWEELGDDAPPGIRVLLDTAEDQRERAEELFRNRRLRAALQLAMQVEKSLQQALEQQGGYQRAQKRYLAQAERYLSLQEQIQLAGPDDRPDIAGALINAEQLRVQAENLAAENRYGRADKTMTRAVEALTRAAERLREPAKIKAAQQRLEKEAERIRERLQATGNSQLLARYRNARQHLDKASEMYQQGDYKAAAAQLQAARQVLHGIMRVLGE